MCGFASHGFETHFSEILFSAENNFGAAVCASHPRRTAGGRFSLHSVPSLLRIRGRGFNINLSNSNSAVSMSNVAREGKHMVLKYNP